jgi:hypothetical protein
MSRFQGSPATKLMFVVLAVCSSIGCLLPKYHSAGCKQRGAALAERVEKLKREANATLKI